MINNEFKVFTDLKAIENLSPNALNLWKYYHNIVDYEKGEGTVLVFSSDEKRCQIATEFKRDLSLINIQFNIDNFPTIMTIDNQRFYFKTLDELDTKIASGIYFAKYKDMHFVD